MINMNEAAAWCSNCQAASGYRSKPPEREGAEWRIRPVHNESLHECLCDIVRMFYWWLINSRPAVWSTQKTQSVITLKPALIINMPARIHLGRQDVHILVSRLNSYSKRTPKNHQNAVMMGFFGLFVIVLFFLNKWTCSGGGWKTKKRWWWWWRVVGVYSVWFWSARCPTAHPRGEASRKHAERRRHPTPAARRLLASH